MADKLPLVVYRDGKRLVVGEVEVFEGIGAVISGISPSLTADLSHLSDESDVNTKRRNVFDQDKD